MSPQPPLNFKLVLPSKTPKVGAMTPMNLNSAFNSKENYYP